MTESWFTPVLRHEPLPQGCIRLINIQNAEFVNNVLRGLELVTFPLNAAPEYEALSYCWGDMRLCTGLFFTNPDGSERVYRVTEDLATCLVSVLQSQTLQIPPYLWIDQISINQEDTLERNRQVANMATIYKSASRVLVWLGQDSDFQPTNEVLPVCPGPETDINGQTLLQFILNSSVFARPWFFRLWVVQEVVLAKYITVLIGRQPLSWSSLVEWTDDLIRCFDSHPSLAVLIIDKTSILTKRVSDCRSEIAADGHINLSKRLLEIAMSQKCRDPRDTIYGILGCTGDIFPTNFAEYRKSAMSTFRDAARIIIDESKSLYILAVYSPETFQVGGDPRWFPQWHLFNKPGLEQMTEGEFCYAASQGRMHVPSAPRDENDVEVRGRVVDTVVTDITVFSDEDDEDDAFFDDPALYCNIRQLCRQSWAQVSHRYCEPERGRPANRAGSGLAWPICFIRDIIDAVLCLDNLEILNYVDTISLDDFYHALFVSFSPKENDGRKNEGKGETYMKAMQEITDEMVRRWPLFTGRKLVLLESGRFGLVQQAVKEGDSIALLHGLTVPCVLQKAKVTNKWHIVGDAFVRDLMQGEGVVWEEDEADTFTLT